jgi:hypothetical protein
MLPCLNLVSEKNGLVCHCLIQLNLCCKVLEICFDPKERLLKIRKVLCYAESYFSLSKLHNVH